MNNDIEILELNAGQAAAFIGVTRRQLGNIIKGPYPPNRQGNKKYRSDDLGQWLIERTKRDVRVEVTKDPDALDGHYELARKNAALADRTELENEVRRSELIEAEEVEVAWVDILSRVKARIMKIPSSIAPLLIGEDDQAVIQERLDEGVRDALSEMSADWREDADSE